MSPQNPLSCRVANSVIHLALQIGLEVVAEGVESQEQADFLREANCTALQGFLISRPLPAQEMTAWLLR
jgi:EAL domain-containing protein (putative c-di-GMP-specific phosphodiesterase class I)